MLKAVDRMRKAIIFLFAFLVALLPLFAPHAVCEAREERQVVTQVVKGENKFISWNLAIPQVRGLADGKVQKEINATFIKDQKAFRDDLEKQARKAYKEAQESGNPFRQFAAYTTYDTHYFSEKILSLTVDMYQYTGGAHGFTTRKAYNYNLETGAQITYKDIFGQKIDYASVIVNEVVSQIQARPEDFFPDAVETVKTFTDEQPFYLTNDGIVMYYGLYEIAPYASGIQEFLIPFSKFKKQAD